jgi:hypothetical protein
MGRALVVCGAHQLFLRCCSQPMNNGSSEMAMITRITSVRFF